MGLYDFTFYDLINRNAVCFKGNDAWFEVDDNRTLTFSEYKEKVDHLACGLQKSGIKKATASGLWEKTVSNIFCFTALLRLWAPLCFPLTGGLRPKKWALI